MIGLDANVLVRYLAQDDPVQSPLATALMEGELSPDLPGFVSVVAMVETVWVLERTFRLPRSAIAAAIERILQIDAILVQHEPEVFTAMMALKMGEARFADALIGALDAAAGCARTATFDRKAARLAGFELLV